MKFQFSQIFHNILTQRDRYSLRVGGPFHFWRPSPARFWCSGRPGAGHQPLVWMLLPGLMLKYCVISIPAADVDVVARINVKILRDINTGGWWPAPGRPLHQYRLRQTPIPFAANTNTVCSKHQYRLQRTPIPFAANTNTVCGKHQYRLQQTPIPSAANTTTKCGKHHTRRGITLASKV